MCRIEKNEHKLFGNLRSSNDAMLWEKREKEMGRKGDKGRESLKSTNNPNQVPV